MCEQMEGGQIMTAANITNSPETERQTGCLNLLPISMAILLALLFAQGAVRAADVVDSAPAQSHVPARSVNEPLAADALQAHLQSAIARQCPDSDAPAIASAIVTNISLALGAGPYPVLGELVEQAAERFLQQRQCAFGDASLRLSDDLAWLTVLIIQDPSKPEDQTILKDQLQTLVDEWIASFSKEQAPIIDRDEAEIKEHLTEVSKSDFTKYVDHYLNSPMYPMLSLPLNEYELKKIQRYLNQKDQFLETMQASGAMRKRPSSLYRRLFGPDRTRIIWIEGQFPNVLEQKMSTLVYKIAVLRAKKYPFVDSIAMENGRIRFMHYGPPFPKDAAEARKIAEQLKSWYQATPEATR